MKSVSAVFLSVFAFFCEFHSAFAQDVLDCDGNSNAVQEALDAAVAAGENRVEIKFTGTCNAFEVVAIAATIVGSGVDTTAVEGFVFVVGSGSNAILRNFTVRAVEIEPGLFEGGIGVTSGASAFDINGVNIDGGELVLQNNAYARVRNGVFTGIGSLRAVTVIRNSTLQSQGGNLFASDCASRPAEDCQATVAVGSDSSWTSTGFPADTYTSFLPGVASLSVNRGSYADLRQGTLDDVEVDLHSVLTFGEGGFGNPEDITINGNVRISRDSAVVFGSDLIQFNGTARCDDSESSLAGRMGGNIKCTKF